MSGHGDRRAGRKSAKISRLSREAVASQVLDIAALHRQLFAGSAAAGLDPGAAEVLLALAVGGDRRAVDIAYDLDLPANVVRKRLSQLNRHEQGLIETASDPRDRRGRVNRLTAAGREKVDELLAHAARVLEPAGPDR
jgi:DNA-binding MarR family transcriptional regulator